MICVSHLANPCVPNLQTKTYLHGNSFNKAKGQFRRTLKVSLFCLFIYRLK